MIKGKSILTSAEKYDIISKNTAEGIIIIDETGSIEEWNEFMENKTTYSKPEITGRKIWDVQTCLLTKDWKEKYPVESLRKIWMSFIHNLSDNEYITKEGQYLSGEKLVLTEDTICRINLNGKSYLYVIQRDRTKRKKTENKDALISIISYELRSLISSIMDFCRLFNNQTGKIDLEKIRKFIREVNSTSEHTIKLLENYSIWLKIQNGILSYLPKRYNLNSSLEKVIYEYNSHTVNKNIEMKVVCTHDIFCYADEDMVKSVLRNLIQNSIRFTNPGGKIWIKALLQQDKIEIIVEDNGTGMNEDMQSRLFRIINDTESGTINGLGLVICKEFVEKHGGKIRVYSKPGIGSTFFFTIPADQN